ncbi:glycoside hydrolase family 3 protein [Pseudocercospora fijiensis CIRAD86]|uniref:beta-glucosidase n=1 Tax=Pseudocercospora fijiensis (strain CIRAD86) TaxID=383855 RepID=M2ZMP3_PSEFD|nr:glycoside hydrolase family 3 protein [Pseudocercospora fijiensis CIRAD86]EME80364.1 glycoside hydrolase family 3 protein [Pseudocercospora fijiensis CIRAD86]
MDEKAAKAKERLPLLKGNVRATACNWCLQHRLITMGIGLGIVLLPLLGLLALHTHGGYAKWTSPGVFPSPQGYGAGNWTESYKKAKAMVAKMSPEEMNNITVGYPTTHTGCVGITGTALKAGFPGLCLHDAGNGVRETDGVNAYASGISVGASWNASMAYERGVFMGAEFKKKGINVALGPVVGPLGRVASGGRNWEGFAADPFMDGVLGAATIMGLQQNVIASVKHFIAYEQETNRNPFSNDDGTVLATSANVDDRTMHECYLWPFQEAVLAGVGSVMCSYQRINNTYGCENSKTINGLLKGELNFQGFVVSDWAAQHSDLATANAGLDMAMPSSDYWGNGKLAAATQGFNQSRLVDMATRIVATWYQLGQDNPNFPPMGVGMPADILAPHDYIDARDVAAKPSILQQAIEGHVLVKNIKGALPLKKPRLLSVFGWSAQSQERQIAMNEIVDNAPSKAMGTLFVGGGSSSNTPAYISTPYDALQNKAYYDDTAIFFDSESTAPGVVTDSDACLVFINDYASENWDRPNLADPDGDDLVKSVARSCNNTIVVIHNAGPRVVDAWIDNTNVTAVIFAHLPGQDAGRSIVSLLYGEVSPSGRLPYTVAKKPGDYRSLQGPCIDTSRDPQCDFEEGVNIDYRYFLARNVAPRYEFGYGLTYSSFDYSSLGVHMDVNSTINTASTSPVYANGTTDNTVNKNMTSGGYEPLFESVGNITATIVNNGSHTASEVAQLYLEIPVPDGALSGMPNTRTLRGFKKQQLTPGQRWDVVFDLRRKDISYWDINNQTWVVPNGQFNVFVGRSVLDTPLVGSFNLK